MSDFESQNGTRISYSDVGEGPAAVLLHGFAADSNTTWGRTGVTDALVQAGFRIISMDSRGHGASARSAEPHNYALEAVIGDVMELMTHLEVDLAAMVGYSVGARMALEIGSRFPHRVRSIALGGAGERVWGSEEIARGMEAPTMNDVSDKRARAFRSFAQATGGDLNSLAAFQRAMLTWPDPEPEMIAAPSLILVGEEDNVAGDTEALAKRIKGAKRTIVPGNHMNAMLNHQFRDALIQFLNNTRTSR